MTKAPSSAAPSLAPGERDQTGARPTVPTRSENSRSATPRKPENPATGGSQPTSENPSRDEEVTRALGTPEKRLSLAEVRMILPDVVEGGPSTQVLREMLGKQIQKTEGFSLARDRTEADALLRVSGGASPAAFAVQLINARGQVIWPFKGATSRRTYSGQPDQISAQILKDLRNDVEYVRRRR